MNPSPMLMSYGGPIIYANKTFLNNRTSTCFQESSYQEDILPNCLVHFIHEFSDIDNIRANIVVSHKYQA